MSFASGLAVGARVGDNWVERYKENQKEEMTNKLFAIGNRMSQEGQQLEAEGEQKTQLFNKFMSMSENDMTAALIQQYAAETGNVDDGAAKMAYGVAQYLQGVKQDGVLFNEKVQSHDMRQRNLNQLFQTRAQRNAQKKKSSGSRTIFNAGKPRSTSPGSAKDKYLSDKGYEKYRGRWSNDAQNDWVSSNKTDAKPEILTDDKGRKYPDTAKGRDAMRKAGNKDISSGGGGDNWLSDTGETTPSNVIKAPKGIKDGKYNIKGKPAEVINGEIHYL